MAKRKNKPTVIDAAIQVLRQNQQPMNFKDLITQAFNLLGKEPEGKLSHYHTEINMDRRFVAMGKGQWGLREWVPKEQRRPAVAPSSHLRESDYQPTAEDYLWDEEEEDIDDESELLVPAEDEDDELYVDEELDIDLGIDSGSEDEEDDEDPLGR